MKARPIPFKGGMVRAILAGRKTQTRRVVKPQFGDGVIPVELYDTTPEGHQCGGHSGLWVDDCDWDQDAAVKCPYGKPGDLLWVRESMREDVIGSVSYARYVADGLTSRHPWHYSRQSCPSIHMPRWASRLTLRITDIRIERLQDISDRGASNDCTAEGVFHAGNLLPDDWQERGFSSIEKCAFHDLWDSINGNWDDNPWVWVVVFEAINRNVDAVLSDQAVSGG